MPLCRLCKHEYVSLRESHIIPKMFYNVIKKNSLIGFMRQTDNPNQSIQDGIKLPFLCAECEELFSKYEKAFSDSIYQNTVKNKGEIQFNSRNDKLAYFLLSISWRVVKYTHEKNLINLTCNEWVKLNEILEKWEKLLLAEDMNEIRKIEQFIIPTKDLKFFKDMPFRSYDNILMDFKTFDSDDTYNFSFTLVQVPYFIFITTFWGHTNSMKQYKLGRIIKAYSSQLPKDITLCLTDLHYNKYFEAYNKISDKQKKTIERRLERKKSI